MSKSQVEAMVRSELRKAGYSTDFIMRYRMAEQVVAQYPSIVNAEDIEDAAKGAVRLYLMVETV